VLIIYRHILNLDIIDTGIFTDDIGFGLLYTTIRYLSIHRSIIFPGIRVSTL